MMFRPSGPGRKQAWPCAQSVGGSSPARCLPCRLGSNLGGPVRVGGSTRLQYCNQRHAASGSAFGCCPSRAGPEIQSPRASYVLGLGLNRGECGYPERDHHIDFMRLFSLLMRQPRELSTATARLMASCESMKLDPSLRDFWRPCWTRAKRPRLPRSSGTRTTSRSRAILRRSLPCSSK
jgi:hypothetical protein